MLLVLLLFFCLVIDGASITEPTCMMNVSRSQDREEEILVDLFFKKRFGGRFVEIGGLDGLIATNTLYLEKCHGWKGLLIEGSPTTWTRLVDNARTKNLRPGSRLLNKAVCTPPKTAVNFTVGRFDTGGVIEEMSDSFKKWYVPGDVAVQEVPCGPMSSLFSPFQDSARQKDKKLHIDLWSLDVEGSEFEAVVTVDWSEVHIDVIIIELDNHNPSKNWRVRSVLATAGSIECRWGTIRRSGMFVHKHSPYTCHKVGQQKCKCSFHDCCECRGPKPALSSHPSTDNRIDTHGICLSP